jgi:DNA replication and repair protein RecF
MFVIQGEFIINGMNESVFCGMRASQKKIFKRNQKEYEKLSEHIGLLPVVVVAPVDHVIITGGSDERRKFIDSIISQTDKEYLQLLIRYNKVLAHRNILLKQLAAQRISDHSSLEIWDEQMVPLGEKIHQRRIEFCASFTVLLKNIYEKLGGANEPVEMAYVSDLTNADFAASLRESFSRDAAVQYTSSGIHKDDLQFMVNGIPAKKFASQGQQKTLVVALKLAQYEMMRSIKHTRPILMLDDIFDKLDEERVARLMGLVAEKEFGQLFITDTHPERVADIFSRMNIPVKKFHLENSMVEDDHDAVSSELRYN